jgi:hypothetical protein
VATAPNMPWQGLLTWLDHQAARRGRWLIGGRIRRQEAGLRELAAGRLPCTESHAGVAQLAEQPSCKRQVSGSNPLTGSRSEGVCTPSGHHSWVESWVECRPAALLSCHA